MGLAGLAGAREAFAEQAGIELDAGAEEDAEGGHEPEGDGYDEDAGSKGAQGLQPEPEASDQRGGDEEKAAEDFCAALKLGEVFFLPGLVAGAVARVRGLVGHGLLPLSGLFDCGVGGFGYVALGGHSGAIC